MATEPLWQIDDPHPEMRMGDELTRPFRPIFEPGEAVLRYGENLAQAFVDLRASIAVDGEVLELFVRADDALGALLAGIWKRSTEEDRAAPSPQEDPHE
jgi:hypothetical protein